MTWPSWDRGMGEVWTSSMDRNSSEARSGGAVGWGRAVLGTKSTLVGCRLMRLSTPAVAQNRDRCFEDIAPKGASPEVAGGCWMQDCDGTKQCHPPPPHPTPSLVQRIIIQLNL